MREPIFSLKAAVSMCLVSMLLMPLPSLAALAAADAARLDSYEKSVFGSVRKSLTEESRLRALETNLFGQIKSGAAKGRLDSIAKMVAPSTKSSTPQYLPPLAAQMDSSAFAKEPAPVAVDNSHDDDAAPAPVARKAEPTDRVKDLLRQALVKHNQGDRAGAQNTFKQVLSIDPRNSDANFNLGAMAEDAGDLQAAQRFYRTAAGSNPSDNEIQDALASVDGKLQQQHQERETASQLAKKGQLRQLAQEAAGAYKAGKYDQAISLLERIDREAPGDANVKYGLGQAYRGKGDMQRANANLRAAASIDPNNQLYRTTLAELDRQQQQQVAQQSQPANSFDDNTPSTGRDYGRMPPVADLPPGQLTPFSNNDDRLYGQVYDGMNRGTGLGGIGSALGFGTLGGGLGGMMRGGNASVSRAPLGSRLVRGAVQGSLAGAAAGAVGSMIGGGGRGLKSGAMRGAMYGGLFGLLSSF